MEKVKKKVLKKPKTNSLPPEESGDTQKEEVDYVFAFSYITD